MQFHEEIYTSAPALLDNSSTGDLGVVARSKGFPSDVQRELEFSRSYHLLAGIPLSEPQLHPPRWICSLHGKASGYYCVTRVVFAGSDHTSRTTPLAHHLAFDKQRLSREVSPAILLNRLSGCDDCFYNKWQGEPKWIEPLRDLNGVGEFSSAEQFPSAETELLLGGPDRVELLSSMAESLLRFPLDKKSVVCLIEVEQAPFAVRLIADVLNLLPRDSQFSSICVTHVVTAADLPANAALIFTYPEAPFAKTSLERRDPHAPFIFDLTNSASIVQPEPGGYAQVVAKVLPMEDTRAARQVGQLYDALQWDLTRLQAFPAIYDLVVGLSQITRSEQLASFQETLMRLKQGKGTLVNNPGFNKWCCDRLIDDTIMVKVPEPDRWKAMSYLLNEDWPLETSKHSLKIIRSEKFGRVALPHALHMFPRGNPRADSIWSETIRFIEKNQSLLIDFMEDAIGGNEYSQQAAEGVINNLSWEPPRLASFVNETLARVGHLPMFVTDALTNYFSKGIGQNANEEGGGAAKSLESLKNVIDLVAQEPPGGLQVLLVRNLLILALQSNSLQHQVKWLSERYPEVLERERLVGLLEDSGKFKLPLRKNLETLGILTPVQVKQSKSPDAGGFVDELPEIEPRIMTAASGRRLTSHHDEESGLSYLKWVSVILGIGLLGTSYWLLISRTGIKHPWLPTTQYVRKDILATLLLTFILSVVCLGVAWCLGKLFLQLFREKLDSRGWWVRWLAVFSVFILFAIVFYILQITQSGIPYWVSVLLLGLSVAGLWSIPLTVDASIKGAPPDRLQAAENLHIVIATTLCLLVIVSLALMLLLKRFSPL